MKPYTESKNVHSFIMIKHKYKREQLMATQVRNVIMNEPVFFFELFDAQLIINGATKPNV